MHTDLAFKQIIIKKKHHSIIVLLMVWADIQYNG